MSAAKCGHAVEKRIVRTLIHEVIADTDAVNLAKRSAHRVVYCLRQRHDPGQRCLALGRVEGFAERGAGNLAVRRACKRRSSGTITSRSWLPLSIIRYAQMKPTLSSITRQS
jgi:hypothetical protein